MYKNTYKFVIIFMVTFSTTQLSAQNVGINIDNSNPDASAMLEIKSTNKGLLIPRISLVDVSNGATPVPAPATGLLVFNTNGAVTGGSGTGFYYWTGSIWAKLQEGTASSDWTLAGNAGTNPATNFVGTTDAADLVFRTNNSEKMRIQSGGNVGIGTNNPLYRLDLANGTFAFGNSNVRTETRDNAGLQGNAGAQSGFFETSAPTNYPAGASSWWHLIDVRHSNNTNNYALQIAGSFFDQELWFRKTNSSATTAWSRLLTSNSGWTTLGNSGTNAGTNFVGTTDAIDFVTRTNNAERMRVTSGGSVHIAKGVMFDCNDCGSTATIDGNANWGDMVIQGRVLSANSNLHLSPPGGNKVIINSVYRAAGGGTGTTGLDIEDGGIRMRKNYMYFQRFLHCGGCYGVGTGTYDLGNWDFCAVAHVGFKNTNSSTDEDDDVQCAVFPTAHGGAGEQTNYTTYYTYQFNAKPAWRMYFEAYADTNGITCAATCMNFE